MPYERGIHSHSAYVNILIHRVTTFQLMNVEKVTSHCNHRKSVGQFDCRAFRDCMVWAVWSAENYTSKSLSDYKEIQPVHPKGDQSWVFTGRTDVEAETPVLWPRDSKSWLMGKDPDAGKDWGQEDKGTTEDEMVGWHHRLNGHEFGEAPGVGDEQGGLACCGSWGHKESDTTDQLNGTELKGKRPPKVNPRRMTPKLFHMLSLSLECLGLFLLLLFFFKPLSSWRRDLYLPGPWLTPWSPLWSLPFFSLFCPFPSKVGSLFFSGT